jgi:hypothetical protein
MADLSQTAQNPSGDFIRATPRNPVLGFLSDIVGASYSPQRTQQMQGIARLFSAPAISQTLDRLAFGEPLTTGAGGIGGTSRPRPEVMEAGFAVTDLLPTSAAAKGAALAVPALAGIFMGPKSKTWDALSAQKAKMLADIGTDPRTIWQQTGTWKGPDGKWRQEISDQTAKLTLGRGKPDEYGAIEAKTFEGALKHQQLKRAYPELNNVTFQHWPNESYQGANFDPSEMIVTMGQKAMEPQRGVALHELQHVIQRNEGFAQGGSPTNVLDEWYSNINNQLRDLSRKMDALPEFERRFDKEKQNQYDVFRSQYDDLMSQKLYNPPNAEDAYRRLAGEAEARAVQQRMNLTPEQRRSTFPEESYDIPLSEVIIRGVE